MENIVNNIDFAQQKLVDNIQIKRNSTFIKSDISTLNKLVFQLYMFRFIGVSFRERIYLLKLEDFIILSLALSTADVSNDAR